MICHEIIDPASTLNLGLGKIRERIEEKEREGKECALPINRLASI